MKSFNVKSNAKRFAKGVAAKYPGRLEAAEPSETIENAREWYPVVALVGDWAEGDIAVLHNLHGDTVLIDGHVFKAGDTFEEGPDKIPFGEVIPNEHDALIEAAGREATTDGAIEMRMAAARAPDAPRAGSFAALAAEGGLSESEIAEVPAAAPAGMAERVGKLFGGKPVDVLTPAEARAKVGNSELAAMAASLPPPTTSTAEEIAERRKARRARIDAGEYAAKPAEAKAKPAKTPKTTRADIIMGLVSQPDGETAEAIAKACDWQAHTLRGYIGGTLRKRLAPDGKTITAIRKPGEPTRYKLEAITKADAA